ncbi:transcriptional regulator [Clostridium butyricum]|uniref:transcriptional regulator n=1 Tax=Clostridium butyricum TaxID=1492 RepID=UPI0028FD923D|nr:transcriptional regulator [Clostridium butyricum]MDU0323332.1 transcriptional regulator [Clostridium butyricum]
MDHTTVINEKIYDMNFLAAWIKYTRIKKHYSQEALCHGICSISHLSYFENGKKPLRPEIIQLLLQRLSLNLNDNLTNIGHIRQKFNTMTSYIETFDHKGAKKIYDELIAIEQILSTSPYYIEFQIYTLIYNTFVINDKYDDLKNNVEMLDKIADSLSNELKSIYFLVSGKLMINTELNEQGLERLQTSRKIKETTWINYTLGRACCFSNSSSKGTYYLEKALINYENSGLYLNAIWCHNYLGVCYSNLKLYKSAEKHFKAALTSAKHFQFDDLLSHIYTSISDLYLNKGDYEKCIEWSLIGMNYTCRHNICVYNYILAKINLKQYDSCDIMFKKYLNEDIQNKFSYSILYFLYLVVHHFDDELFYNEIKNNLLPYFESIKRLDIVRDVKLKFIEYLENHRKYKEANQLYKELLSETM